MISASAERQAPLLIYFSSAHSLLNILKPCIEICRSISIIRETSCMFHNTSLFACMIFCMNRSVVVVVISSIHQLLCKKVLIHDIYCTVKENKQWSNILYLLDVVWQKVVWLRICTTTGFVAIWSNTTDTNYIHGKLIII